MELRVTLDQAKDLLRPLASDPPPQHWLSSDATFSYCFKCARKARAKELGYKKPPPPGRWYRRTVAEEKMREGIDGGDWYSGTADTPQACETCRQTLRYSLTDYGQGEELHNFRKPALTRQHLANPDCAYEVMEALSGAEYGDTFVKRDARSVAIRVIKLLSGIPASTASQAE